MEDRTNFFNRELRDSTLKQSEEKYKKRHNKWLTDKIDERRNLNPNFNNKTNSNENSTTGSEIYSLNSIEKINLNENNELINIQFVNDSLFFLYQKNYLDKYKTRMTLKILRKELSKSAINEEILPQILENQQLLIILADFLFDFKNSEIQLETLWILNNLCIYSHKFKFDYHFNEIHKLLINLMLSESKFSNSGVKNLILEKFFSLLGNLILYEENVFHFYIGNNIIAYLLKNLNSSVKSLRYVCLLTINNIVNAVNRCNDNSEKIVNSKQTIFNDLFDSKDALYYLKFLFSRVDPSKNFDECYEFLWLLNYFSVENYNLFLFLFLKDNQLNIENINKIIFFLVYDKLHQPSIRILGNLLISPYSGNISQLILEDKNVIFFILNFLKNYSSADAVENPQNFSSTVEIFPDVYLIKDVIWFLKNLSSYDPLTIENYFLLYLLILLEKICSIYQNFILESEREKEFTLQEIIKNILIIFYNINSLSNFVKLNKQNDDLFQTNARLINFILPNFKNFNFDFSLRFIVIDFLICYNRVNQIANIPTELLEKIKIYSENNM